MSRASIALGSTLVFVTLFGEPFGVVKPAFAQQQQHQHQHQLQHQHQQHQHQKQAPVPDSSLAEQASRAFTAPPAVPNQHGPTWNRNSPGPVQSYSLDDLLSIATQQNPTLVQARLHIRAQLARAMQAGLYPNPVMRYLGEQIGVDVDGDKDSPGEWQGAEIEQRIVTAGKLELSREKYRQRAQVAEHLAVAQQFRVCNDIRIHFYRVVAADQTVVLQHELLKTAEDRLVTKREMYNLGQANRADVHNANAMLQKHRLQLMMAKNEVRRHQIQLAALVGMELDGATIQGDLHSVRDAIDFDEAYANLQADSPELLAARAKLREDCITIRREQVEWIPDLVVGGGAGYNFEAKETTAAASLSIEVPLYDRNEGTIQQAHADYSRQLREIRRIELDLRSRLANEYHRYITALQHVSEFDAVILPARRKSYQLHLKSYKANRSEWPDTLDAQENYTNARLNLIRHRLSLKESETLIDGFLLHGGLQAASGPVPGGHIDSVPKPR